MISRASALWAQGLPVAEVGRRMHVTKNVISGLAYRYRDRFPRRRYLVCDGGFVRLVAVARNGGG